MARVSLHNSKVKGIKKELTALRTENEKLKAVLLWCCEQVWECCDIDGGDFQERMQAAELLVEVPASEDVRAEYDTDVMLVTSWSPLAKAKGEG